MERPGRASLPGARAAQGYRRQVLAGASGAPEVIPLEMCYLGWQESLAQLATLVEPEITG